jgi:predicted phosphoadenosine phosphosulfate sulfurtransferase
MNQAVIDSMARSVFAAVQAAVMDEQFQKEFESWLEGVKENA